jgi:hypothetical protein
VKSERLAAHLSQDRYGDFWLTDAIRPSLDLQIVPSAGYRSDSYRDSRTGLEIPALVAAVSREALFEVFLNLLDPLGELVDVVLETSHASEASQHRDLYREHIDLSVFKSHCYDFEDLLLHDGCTGVAVIGTSTPMEVQFDEHKLLVIYARDRKPFEKTFEGAHIPYREHMRFITEGEHLHSTEERYIEEFEQFSVRLGVDEAAEHVNW